MTVLVYIKGVLILLALFFGVTFLGTGVWNVWSAYRFKRYSKKHEGVFKGYHTVYHGSRIKDASGFRSRLRSQESLPMFSYSDAQVRTHNITGTDGHLFKHMKFRQKV